MRSQTLARGRAGQTLVLALIVLFVLTISAGAIAQLMTSNQNASGRERQGVQAFTGGEAGLDLAANAVVAADTPAATRRRCNAAPGSQTIAGNQRELDGDEDRRFPVDDRFDDGFAER